MQDAYDYGRVLQALNSPQAAQMTFGQFQAYLRKNPVPLSPIEQQAADIAASRAAQFVVGLGNRVATDTGQLLIEADAGLRRQMQDTIKTKVAQGIAERQSIKEIKSNLGHAMQDWTRDLDRIAATETSRAMNEGMAAEVRKQNGSDAEVSIRSRRGCCDQCRSLYYGADGAPIIFRLTDVEANGTNYKKKKADWLPVMPPMHPNCMCTLVTVPPGWGYNAAGQLVPKGTLGIRPHAPTRKSFAAQAASLAKGNMADSASLSWFGIRLKDVRPLPGGHHIADIQTPSGRAPCLAGPHEMAPDAYVAHLPAGDHIVLGFHSADAARMALAGCGLGPAGVPMSAVPVHQLAEWAAGPGVESFTLSEPEQPQMHKAARREGSQRLENGRLVLPVVARHEPRLAREEIAPDTVLVLNAPDPTPPPKPKKPLDVGGLPRTVRPMHFSADPLDVAEDDDDAVGQQTRIVLRERLLRRPITDLGLNA